MQKAKMQYAMAGVQDMPGMRMNVRSSVHIPDAEAGSDAEPARQPYRAEKVVRKSAGPMMISRKVAAVFLGALILLFGVLVLCKNGERVKAVSEIDACRNAIVQATQLNSQLTVQVMEARDRARICYAAVQNLGMVAATGVDAIHVTAPDTRPFTPDNAYAGNSPIPTGLSAMTGSR